MTTVEDTTRNGRTVPSFTLSASGVPHAVAAATAAFKAAMLAADRLILSGRAADDEVQARVSAACDALSEHLRTHLRAGEPDATRSALSCTVKPTRTSASAP